MVAGDQSSQLAPRHLEILPGGIEIAADHSDFAAYRFDLFGAGLCGQLTFDGAVHGGDLLCILFTGLRRLLAGLLQLALRNAPPRGLQAESPHHSDPIEIKMVIVCLTSAEDENKY